MPIVQTAYRGIDKLVLENPLVQTRNLTDILRLMNYTTGDSGTLTGAASAVTITPGLYTDISLISSGVTDTAATNDFDLTDGIHGQELKISLGVLGNAGDTVTVTEKAGTTIVAADGSTGVTTITFASVGKYVVLRFEFDKWRILKTTATVA